MATTGTSSTYIADRDKVRGFDADDEAERRLLQVVDSQEKTATRRMTKHERPTITVRKNMTSPSKLQSHNPTAILSAILMAIEAILLLSQSTRSSLAQLATSSLSSTPTHRTASIRLCVTTADYNECLQMVRATNGTMGCVKTRDRYECMKHIIDDKADIMNLNNEELYLAGRLYNLEPFAMEQYDGDTQHYKSVVIINNKADINSIADLKGKRSCHGALNSTHGFDIPVGLLLATMTMPPDCRGELYSVAKFFDQSCAPEKLHPNLCGACQNATLCSSLDEFAGDDGTLRCLFSGYGQVAFTTSRNVEKYLLADRLDRRLVNNFVYLCLDGSKLPLDTGRPCEWAHKPTNVFVTSPQKSSSEKELYLNFLQLMFARFVPYKPSWWQMRSLFSDPAHVTNILPLPVYLQKWSDYLGNYISSIEKPLPLCELNSVSMCTSSLNEELKCLDLQKAAFSLRIRPEIDCRRKPSKRDCLETVAKRQADLASADLSDLYDSPQELISQLEPVAIAQGFTDYSVALVRADSDIKFLYQLAGRRSCHASFGDTASWLAPLSVLTERSLLDQKSCNKADQMSEYFGGSCVPGASDLRINYYRSGYEKLCAICRGDSHLSTPGTHQCEKSQSEQYYGQTGALRCLVEGSGDVAFMSLLSLAANVDGRSQEPWARNIPLALDSRNFRLICRTGPNMALTNYERCHLAKLPGRIMVSSKFKSKEERITSRYLLAKLAEKFGPNSNNRELFQLFGPYMNESDLLFDDSTNNIATLKLDQSTFDHMTQQHFDSSFQQLPITHKETSCKLVLTTSGTASSLTPNLQSSTILLISLMMVMIIPNLKLHSSILKCT